MNEATFFKSLNKSHLQKILLKKKKKKYNVSILIMGRMRVLSDSLYCLIYCVPLRETAYFFFDCRDERSYFRRIYAAFYHTIPPLFRDEMIEGPGCQEISLSSISLPAAGKEKVAPYLLVDIIYIIFI